MGTIAYLRPTGQDLPRKRGDRLTLSEEEARHLRASLKNLRAAFGTWACLAGAMKVSLNAIEGVIAGRCRGSGTLAWRAARASGVSVEVLLTGKLSEAGACPACGRKAVSS